MTEKIPPIRIGPVTYDVIQGEDLRGLDDQRLAAQIMSMEAKILLDVTLAPQIKRVALWHEAIHAILEQSGREEDHDEGVINALAFGIVQILEDNPYLRGG